MQKIVNLIATAISLLFFIGITFFIGLYVKILTIAFVKGWSVL